MSKSDQPRIEIVKMPSLMYLAMAVAPLVRREIITDAEGRALVDLHYRRALQELRSRT